MHVYIPSSLFVTFVNIKIFLPSEVFIEDFATELFSSPVLHDIVGFGAPSAVHVKLMFVPSSTVLVLRVLVIKTLGTTTTNKTEKNFNFVY